MLDSAIDITGKWFNKNTGKTVNVRNSVMDNDQMIIMTEYGAISSEEFMRDYIQVSDDMFDESGNKIGSEKVTKDDFKIDKKLPLKKPEINLETTAFDNLENFNLNINEQENNYTPVKTKNVNIIDNNQIKIKQYDESIIKFFNKIKTKPEINIFIKWNDFPFDKLNTLIEYLDIDKNDIISYIKENYLQNDEELTNSIKNTFFNNSEDEETLE